MYFIPFLLISQSFAQPGSDSVETQTRQTVAYRKVTVLDDDAFAGLSLDGVLVRPSGLLSVETPRPAFHSLFQLRRNFEVEIEESPSNIRRLSGP